ncbi:hypothetical protein IAD21_02684 [Abditibacteriota bacterium]|nr:hypothetical protein IAD21_02684 [Abditibacteriota bacterium]
MLGVGVMLGTFSVLPAHAQFLRVRGATRRVHGMNMAWMKGAYDHDIGTNPLHPSWTVPYSGADVSTYFADIRNMKCNVVRVWLFEGCEGLTFDGSGNVNGLDGRFLTNLDDLMNRADVNGLAVYLTFLSFDLKNQFGQTLPNGAHIQNFINSDPPMNALIERAIVPIAQRYRGRAAVFGYDLINESNLGADNGSYTWARMRGFGNWARKRIKDVDASAQVTMSTQWRDAFTPSNFSSSYGGLGFDFYDYHDYSDTPDIVYKTGTATDKPLLLGEYGPKTSSRQRAVTDSYVGQARDRGWAGSLAWAYQDGSFSYVNSPGNWTDAAWALQWWGGQLGTG